MQVRTEIEVAASVVEVWRTLVDFAAYPEWNPFMVEVVGELRPDAQFDLTLSFPDSHREQKARRRLSRHEPERELRWLGHWGMKGLFDTEHFIRLEPSHEGTRVVQGADFTGILLKTMLQTVTHATRGFVYMNQALKRRIEARNERRNGMNPPDGV